jgi:hypothetical protein
LDEPTVFAQQTMRLGYLRRKFYEAMRAGRKIVTISRAEPRKHPIPLALAGERELREEKPERLRFAEVQPLFLRLNECGTNTLLYLTRCSYNRRPGVVELLAPGVMRGYVDDFVILPDPDNWDHATWLRIAANAWLLDQGPNASFRKIAPSHKSNNHDRAAGHRFARGRRDRRAKAAAAVVPAGCECRLCDAPAPITPRGNQNANRAD